LLERRGRPAAPYPLKRKGTGYHPIFVECGPPDCYGLATLPRTAVSPHFPFQKNKKPRSLAWHHYFCPKCINADYQSSLLVRVGQVTVEIKLGFDPKLLLDSFVQKQITPCCTRLFANSPLTSSRTPGSILYNQYITQFYLCQSTFYLNILFIISVVITILSSAICHKSS